MFQGAHLQIVGCTIPGRDLLTLKTVSAHTTILSSTSRTVLTQTFENPTKQKYSTARYVFPLFEGISVVNYTCKIGSRLIKGVVKEKVQAKQEFQAAVARGEKAGLLEQSEAASDVFTTTIGNIGEFETVIVEITFLSELKHDAEVDGLRFTLPTHIAPRYSPGRMLTENHLQSSVSSDTSSAKLQVTIDVDMASGTTIKSVQSPSHPINVNIGTTSTAASEDPSFQRASATLSQQEAVLDKDVVIQICTNNLGDPSAVLEVHPTIPNRRALMATLVPRFNLPVEQPEVVFVCDRSGSMGGGSKIPNLQKALEIFLKSLPVGVLFNICSFGSRYDLLWPQSQAYDQNSLNTAINHIKTFESNYGGTEMYNPIKAVVDERAKDRNLEIFLLTDGEIWNQDQLFQLINSSVADSKGAVRVFSLGIGRDASHALIEGIARAGNGFAQSVSEDENMNKKVIRMLKGALTPHVQDYSLEIKYDKENDDDEFELVEKLDDCLVLNRVETEKYQSSEEKTKPEEPKPVISLHDMNVQNEDLQMPDNATAPEPTPLPDLKTPRYLQAPYTIPPLFPFNRTTVYVLLSEDGVARQPKSVLLKGTSPNGPLQLEIPITQLAEKGTTIHQLAARKAVQDLEEGRGWVYRMKDESGKSIKETYALRIADVAQAQGVKLGVEYQVSNKWCSFVALETDEDKEKVIEEEIDVISKEEIEDQTYAATTFARKSAVGLSRAAVGGPPRPIAASYIPTGDSWGVGIPQFDNHSNMFAAQQMSVQPQAWPQQQMQNSAPAAQYHSMGGLQSMGNSSPFKYASVSPQSAAFGSAAPPALRLASAAPGSSARARTGAPPPPPPAAPHFAYGSDMCAAERSSLRAKPKKKAAKESAAVDVILSLDFACDVDDDEEMVEPEQEGVVSGSSLFDLVSLQEFGGNWTWTEALTKALGISKDSALKIQLPATYTDHDDVLATLCAIVYLKRKLADEKDVWELMVEKAEGWVAAKTGGNVAELEKAFEGLF